MKKATNRQKKFLSLFGVKYSPNISMGAAGWEISDILAESENQERWRRYLFLTKDFDSDSPVPKDFTELELTTVNIPDDWDPEIEIEKYRDEIVSQEMNDGSPFDRPQPEIQFEGHNFMFTGKFSFGTRKDCQLAVEECGGNIPSSSSMQGVDFLVVGNEGSKAWSRGSYGNKIKKAVLCRRQCGKPAIISEEHWCAQIKR